jgi:hypothetical protein
MTNTQKNRSTAIHSSRLAAICDFNFSDSVWSFGAKGLGDFRGLADVSSKTAKKPINSMGAQPMPIHVGPKGTSHIPPAQAKRATSTKNHRKLFQGPLVPNVTVAIQTKQNPIIKATNKSAINMQYSFLPI